MASRNNPLYTPPQILPWGEMNVLFGEEVREFRKNKSGIHVALMATTRGGKTTLATGGGTGTGILSHFPDCLILDSTGDPGPIKDYGEPVKRFGSIRGHQRLTVHDMSGKSREKIFRYVNRAVGQKHVAIYVDELRQIVDKKFFDLGKTMDHVWLFCAKRGTSLIGASQAPRWLPSSFYDQSKVHFIFGMRDRRAMKRLAEISGDVDTLEVVIPNLARYEFAHVGIEGSVSLSKFEMPKTPPKQSEKEPGLTVVRPSRTMQVRR